jgi:LPXTG-motif cell wall-anchored protein
MAVRRRRGSAVGKRWTWVAWFLLVVFVLSAILAVILEIANGTLQHDAANQTLLFLGFGAFMAVGALIVAHRPGNDIGWIFSAIALLAATTQLASEYSVYAYTTRAGSLPGAILAAWYGSWPWWLVFALALVFTPLLFPTGRLLSPRWRPVAWLAGAVTAALMMLTAFEANLGTIGGQVIANPIGVAWVANPQTGAVGTTLFGLLILSIVAAFASLVIRFRRSRGEERQQLKWFTFACALLPLAAVGDALPAAVGGGLVFGALIVFLPVATGIAILRYRLYDIDRLINRTLVYGLLTALLAGVYAATVLVLGQVFGGVGKDPPSWAVAGATLAVAALFQPGRRRIQAVVDRRFNRRKYNAARTVEAFSVRLRDEVDLDALAAELLTVANQTMQPTTMSLWLRPAPQARPPGR